MRWVNPLLANRRARLEEAARFCQRYGLGLRRIARRELALEADSPLARCFLEAAAIHFRRRDGYLAELRALTPKATR